ncbi:MAG: hypothetical protein ACJAVV_002249 [Alphaproteobacteria bacterium]|jgi:hypothetical protein
MLSLGSIGWKQKFCTLFKDAFQRTTFDFRYAIVCALKILAV